LSVLIPALWRCTGGEWHQKAESTSINVEENTIEHQQHVSFPPIEDIHLSHVVSLPILGLD
jgi:hypothetical protein